MVNTACAAVGMALSLAASATSQTAVPRPTEVAKLTASDAGAADHFGIAVGVSGTTAIVGSRDDDNAGGVDAGSAYVYVRSGTNWIEQAKLTASDAAAGDGLGASAALSGDTAVVGTYVETHNGEVEAGAAYVYERSGASWTELAKLTAADSESGDWFGQVVTVDGDTVVVGSPFDDNAGGINAGAAYVYVRSGTSWIEQAKLTASDAAVGDTFGSQVSVSGDMLVVGAPWDDDWGSFSGSAYVFVRTGTSWSEEAKLTASDAMAGDAFGAGAAVSGGLVVVGAPRDSDFGPGSGSAYVFVRNGASWTQQAKLTASDAAANDSFGLPVAVSGDTVVVGVYGDDNAAGVDAGAMYVYGRTGTSWSEQAKVTASDAAAGDLMGAGIALAGDTAVVGALQYGAGGFDAGAAYVFHLATLGSWADLRNGLIGSDGIPEALGVGTLLPGSPVTLSLSTAKPFSFAAIVVGITAINVPFKGGVMVPGLDLIFALTTDGLGTSTFGGLWPSGVPSGFATYFQWWIKDPAGSAGFAASNAVAGTAP